MGRKEDSCSEDQSKGTDCGKLFTKIHRDLPIDVSAPVLVALFHKFLRKLTVQLKTGTCCQDTLF